MYDGSASVHRVALDIPYFLNYFQISRVMSCLKTLCGRIFGRMVFILELFFNKALSVRVSFKTLFLNEARYFLKERICVMTKISEHFVQLFLCNILFRSVLIHFTSFKRVKLSTISVRCASSSPYPLDLDLDVK